MTTITLDGNAGLDFSYEETRQQIESARDDIAIVLNPANDYTLDEPWDLVDPSVAGEWLSLYESLVDHPQAVSVHIAGAVCLEGLLAMAADSVTIEPKASFRLAAVWINPPASATIHNVKEILERLDPAFVEAYAEGSGQSFERIARLMVVGTKMNPKQAVSLGFADRIVEGRLSAKIRSSRKVRNMKSTVLSTQGAGAKFRRIVAQKMARGMTRSQAVADTARRNPRLHSLMLLEGNPRASKGTKNAIRAHGGLKVRR